jgi:hypothetical protein
MNNGQGAHLRYQDYVLQTGQPSVSGEAVDDRAAPGYPPAVSEHEQAQREAGRTRARFIVAMAAAGNPGAKSLPQYPTPEMVACWPVAETMEGNKTSYQRTWYLTTADKIGYVTREWIKDGRFRRPRSQEALYYKGGSLAAIEIAEACKRIARDHGVVLDPG